MKKLYKYHCLDCDWTREHTRPQRGVRCKLCAIRKVSKENIDPTKTTCPKCGEKKSYTSTHCIKCVDRTGENNGMYGKKNPALSKSNRLRKPEEHWNWKGGHESKRDPKTLSWSKHVRNVGKCDCCGFNNKLALDAHHLEGYSTREDLRYEIDNGVCLCKNCHTIFHKKYGYGDNTKQQYLEFKENY